MFDHAEASPQTRAGPLKRGHWVWMEKYVHPPLKAAKQCHAWLEGTHVDARKQHPLLERSCTVVLLLA
jgi:hypothetical protein